MKIFIFGCGNIYSIKKHEIPENVEILGIIDNDKALWGKEIDGIRVWAPQEIQKTDFDYIVLMSNAAIEMRNQLLQLKHTREKIIHFGDFFGLFPQKMKIYKANVKREQQIKKTLLIISVPLVFNGVPVVSLMTAKVAMRLGYLVTIAAEDGDERYIKEARDQGIQIIFYKELSNALLEDLFWIDDFDAVLVNSILMIRLAIKLSQKRKVNLWVHECSASYFGIKFWEDEIKTGIQNEKLNIYAVSVRAKEIFFHFFPTTKEMKILPFGVEDRKEGHSSFNSKFSYGIIGEIGAHKGQDIFLSALDKFPESVLSRSFFFMIGKKIADEAGREIGRHAFSINNCILLGNRTYSEMKEMYQILDVLVVASKEETVSMVAVEAMMMGKVCIVSNHTGVAEYIEQGENGFVFQSGNVDELKKYMLWCYMNKKQLRRIGKNARETYEQYFSMKKFEEQVGIILKD